MPCDYKKYPGNWGNIRIAIISRAGDCCELCGAPNGKPHWKTGAIVVLTIHHINFIVTDNRLYNLLALCQRCHNKLDMPHRVDTRRAKSKTGEQTSCVK